MNSTAASEGGGQGMSKAADCYGALSDKSFRLVSKQASKSSVAEAIASAIRVRLAIFGWAIN